MAKGISGQCQEAPTLRRLRKKTAVPGVARAVRSIEKFSKQPAPLQKTNGFVERRGKFVLKERGADYVVLRGALSEADLRKADDFLQKQKPEPARMKNEGEGEDDHERKVVYNDRDCKVFWFYMQEHCPWMQTLFAEIIRDVGNVEWPLLKVDKASGNVICEWEQTQYTVYGPGEHFYCWHQDAYADGHDQEDARQFTLVVMLTRKDEYDDGAFEMKLPAPSGRKSMFLRRSIRLDAGDIVLFPAKELVHRVRPVTRGIRRTLVFWANDRKSCHFYNPKLKQTRKRRSK